MNKQLEQLSTMHAIVTKDVCFHLKTNQQAPPKKKGKGQKGHCWLSLRHQTLSHFKHSDLLFLVDLSDKKEVKDKGKRDEKKY